MYVAAKVQIKIENYLICVKNKTVCAHNWLEMFGRY